MKKPEMIVVRTNNDFYYVVQWDWMEEFQNDESGDWDAIPASFYGYHYNRTTQTIAQDENLIYGIDVDKVMVI